MIFNQYILFFQCIALLNKSGQPEAIELAELLSKYTLEGLFYSHDRIASTEPVFPPSPDSSASPEHLPSQPESDPPEPEFVGQPEMSVDNANMASNYHQENVKIVRIDKTNEPLVRFSIILYLILC